MTTKNKYYQKEKALKIVTNDGTELQFCSQKLKNDEDVVMAAIKNANWAFEYTSNELKSNKAFVLKVLNEGIDPWRVIKFSNISLQSDMEVINLAVEKSEHAWAFGYAQGEAALSKELAAKALVKWGSRDYTDTRLWESLHPTIKEFFQIDSWYEKAKVYLYQLEQEKQAELVAGGSTTEDEVVW